MLKFAKDSHNETFHFQNDQSRNAGNAIVYSLSPARIFLRWNWKKASIESGFFVLLT